MDDIRGRSTREFDSARLAALTKHPQPDPPPTPTTSETRTERAPQREVQQIDAAAVVSVGRATTLDDPLTTGLLAEVARRSQTTDFDEELIKEVLNKIDTSAASHPHTRRRSR